MGVRVKTGDAGQSVLELKEPLTLCQTNTKHQLADVMTIGRNTIMAFWLKSRNFWLDIIVEQERIKLQTPSRRATKPTAKSSLFQTPRWCRMRQWTKCWVGRSLHIRFLSTAVNALNTKLNTADSCCTMSCENMYSERILRKPQRSRPATYFRLRDLEISPQRSSKVKDCIIVWN